MGKCVGKQQCPKCHELGGDTSEDNLAIYADGSTYCYACGFYEKSESAMTEKVADNIKEFTVKSLSSRSLSEEIARHFNYGVARFDGYLGGNLVSNEPVHVAKYYTADGQEAAVKIRSKNKDFKYIGETDNIGLFGQHLYEASDKVFITITEGEIDAMSVAQVMGKQYPVVSLPNGGGKQAKSFIKKHLDYLSGFKYAVLCFDNDEAGQLATKECAELFPLGKVKIARLPCKDANETLVAGLTKELRDAIWNAKSYRPDSVLTIDDILKKGLKQPKMGLEWPWPKLTHLTYGIQPCQLYTIGGGSGSGKTTVLKDILFHLAFKYNKKIGIISLEQTPEMVLLKLAGSLLGKRLHVPDQNVKWDKEEISEVLDKLKEHVYIYDHLGGQDSETILNKIEYMVRGLDCEYIILDHLTALTAHVKNEKVNAIDDMMSKLSSLVHGLECTIFAVSHLAKPAFGQSYEEGAKISASAFRGSQAIQYWSTFMIGIERNKVHEDEEERHVITLRILKDRFSGEADGHYFELQYDKECDKLKEIDREILGDFEESNYE